MNERTLQILNAAITVFSKYGVAKTTMSDIAEAAGVARQTVYNSFATKTEILRAAVRHEIDISVQQVQEAWLDCETLGQRIEAFHTLGPIRWYELTRSSPELAELLEGIHSVAQEELLRGEQIWKDLFHQMFLELGQVSKDRRLTRDDLVDFLYASSVNAKYGIQSREALERRLMVAKISTLMLIPD